MGDQGQRLRAEIRITTRDSSQYACEFAGLSLPDEFATQLLVNGIALTSGPIGETNRGNRKRDDKGEILIAGVPFRVAAIVVRTALGYWVRIDARKKKATRKAGGPTKT